MAYKINRELFPPYMNVPDCKLYSHVYVTLQSYKLSWEIIY